MHVFLYQAGSRFRGLLDELNSVRMKPVEINQQFFRGDLRLLNRAGYDSHAFLLFESDEVIGQITKLRRAGCKHPVLVLSETRDSETAAQALDSGADDVVALPVEAVELKARINAVLRRAHGHSSESVTIGEVKAFFDGRDPEIAGQRVKLSQREHTIFQQLVLNARRVTSKAAIYDAVYGMSDEQPFDKVIDVYICKIRKKIGQAAPSGHQYIETVHGRGYKFDEAAEAPQPAPRAEPPRAAAC